MKIIGWRKIKRYKMKQLLKKKPNKNDELSISILLIGSELSGKSK
jgi:hypothetical protein